MASEDFWEGQKLPKHCLVCINGSKRRAGLIHRFWQIERKMVVMGCVTAKAGKNQFCEEAQHVLSGKQTIGKKVLKT